MLLIPKECVKRISTIQLSAEESSEWIEATKEFSEKLISIVLGEFRATETKATAGCCTRSVSVGIVDCPITVVVCSFVI